MKLLKDILYKVPIESVLGSTQGMVHNLHSDSRKVSLNDLFVAVRGLQSDGHDYVNKAVEQGALAVVCEVLPEKLINGVTYIVVKDSSEVLGQLAANFYDHPSSKLTLIGITGTNGKTTVATLLFELFKSLGYSSGLISTVKQAINENIFPATHTTPDCISIHKLLSEMVASGVAYCFMEVSSHGIDQKRIGGLDFSGAVFTNLTHDHLDYHKTFASYRDTKKLFFDQLKNSAFALVNIDDKNGLVMLQNTKAKKRSYALKKVADYKGIILENQFSGMLMRFQQQEFWTRLVGEFNAYNLLAVYAVALELGANPNEVMASLSSLHAVEGRFQCLTSNDNTIAIVDYAHTPDALENVLETIAALRTGNENLITVLGCGGDRDQDKRPKMGQIAASKSNQVILTSDNPRSEDPQKIIEAMESGVDAHDQRKVLMIIDRKQAIKTACQLANKGDIILVAGKGHETYQEIMGIRHPFDDRQIIRECFHQLKS